SISPPVQAAVELEPTYKEVETNTDTLGLYLLLETVCTRSALDNSESYRAQLVNHHYEKGDCIFSWFVTFDDLVKNINRTGSGSFKDSDMVYRLRENLPSETSERILTAAHAHKAGEPEYPTFAWCKRVVTTFLGDKTKVNHDEEYNGASAFLTQQSRGVKPPRGGKPRSTKHNNKDCSVTVVCPNCNKPHLLEFCFFDPLGKYCYPDVRDAHHADIANGGTGRQANKGGGKQPNNSAPNKAYLTSMDEGLLQEDADMDGNYMVTSGRLNAVTYSHGDEEEVDYSESPPPEHESPGSDSRSQAAVPDTVPAEQEEGEVMDTDDNNINTNDIPDNSPAPAPVFVMHIDGVGYTAAMLSSAVAAQTADSKAGKEKLRQKGWGTLLP
ncbi:hypothetical protein B484DRAFT_461601, partial [Ochromonadaceae sp. CCMP2298]